MTSPGSYNIAAEKRKSLIDAVLFIALAPYQA
jgi:hypothetical protein